MIAVKEMITHGISLNKSLSFSGVSKAKWYYIKKPRSISLDSGMASSVQEMGASFLTYSSIPCAMTWCFPRILSEAYAVCSSV